MSKKKLTSEEIKNKILTDEDFINSSKYNYSLKNFETSNPNGVSDYLAAKFLFMSVDDFKKILNSIIKKCRQALKIELDSDYESEI